MTALVLIGTVVVSLLPVLPYLVILLQYPCSMHAGLIQRTGRVWRLEIGSEALCVLVDERKVGEFSLADVASARCARNSNWSESKLVEDALSLFDVRGRRLVKLPCSAKQVDALRGALARRNVPVEDVYVEAPSFLD